MRAADEIVAMNSDCASFHYNSYTVFRLKKKIKTVETELQKMYKEHISSVIWIKRRFGFFSFYQALSQNEIGNWEKNSKQQNENAWKYECKNINRKRIQENGKLEKN